METRWLWNAVSFLNLALWVGESAQGKSGTEWTAIREANILSGKLTCGAWEANRSLPVFQTSLRTGI
jgi:hypothetical protein